MWFFIIAGLIMLLIYFPIGIVLLIIGAICAAFRAKDKEKGIPYENQRKCPFCAEIIREEAIVCKHCHRDVPKYEKPAEPRMGYDIPVEGYCGFCFANMKSGAKRCWNYKKVFQDQDYAKLKEA